MILILVAVGGLFIHNMTTPEVTNVPSPMVAKGVVPEKTIVIPGLEQATEQAATTAMNPGIPADATDTTTSGQSEVANDAVQVADALLPETTTVVEPVNTDAETIWHPQESDVAVAEEQEASIPEDNTAAESAVAEAPVLPVAELAEVDESSYEVEEVISAPVLSATVNPSIIKISRTVKERPELELNRSAYQAYLNEDLNTASRLYQESLSTTPDNRDALLGLAAINLRQSQPEAAWKIYQKILRLNPGDAAGRSWTD